MVGAKLMRIYRLLLRVFPPGFRSEFGPDMEAHLEEALEQARLQGASPTLLWLHAAVDAVTEGLAERLRTKRKRRSKQKKGALSPSAARAKRVAKREPWGWGPTAVKGALVPFYIRDVRQTLRSLAQSPGFTVTAVATLALGIGASTTVFSVLDGVLLSPLPYPEPERLVRVFEQAPEVPEFPLAPGNFLDYREVSRRRDAHRRDTRTRRNGLARGLSARTPRHPHRADPGTPSRVSAGRDFYQYLTLSNIRHNINM